MRMLVECGKSYHIEVNADDFDSAVRAAFELRLPMVIGEIIGVRRANPKKKGGWDTTEYKSSEFLLNDIHALDLYLRHKGGFVLNTDSPLVQKVKPEGC